MMAVEELGLPLLTLARLHILTSRCGMSLKQVRVVFSLNVKKAEAPLSDLTYD